MTLSPPKLSDLPYGTKLKAGLGESTVIADFDFETYSPAGFVWVPELNKWKAPHGAREKGLPTVGTVAYTEHPDAEVLCMAYDLKDGRGRRLWVPSDNYRPDDLFAYLQSGRLLEAWNVGFEYWVWTNICVPKSGFPPLPVAQLRCAAAKARAFSLPGSLANAGSVLKITKEKDKRGTALIKKFCIPRDPTKLNLTLRNPINGEDAQELYAYCLRDIEAEAEISSMVPDLSDFELEFWQCDQAINRRGVQVDVEAVEAAISIVEQTYAKYNAELYEITDGAVTSASQLPKMKEWLKEQAGYNYDAPMDSRIRGDFYFKCDSLTEDCIVIFLNKYELPNDVRRVLEIRQLIGSAAIKKLYALKHQVSKHGRVHNLFVYHQARTGRAAGVGPQPQNLPNSGPDVSQCPSCKKYQNNISYSGCAWCGYNPGVTRHSPKHFSGGEPWYRGEWSAEAAEHAISVIKTGSLIALEYYYDDALATLCGCLRGMFIAKPRHMLICSDYSAIEAVALSELAGEKWRQEVFRTHGKIYEMSASKITGVPFEEYLAYKERTGTHHPDRKKVGKIAELAAGYGGGVNSWVSFGAGEFYTESEIKEKVKIWRKANPAIVNFWHGLQKSAVQAILNPGVEFSYRRIVYHVHNKVLYCRLLSGRNLTYHFPTLTHHEYWGYQISYEGWNTNPKNGPTNRWIVMRTHGGKLAENVASGCSRDILAYAIVNLERKGWPVVLHVHDEIVSEIPESPNPDPAAAIENFERIMSTMPEWAANWPVRASGGWMAKRYSK